MTVGAGEVKKHHPGQCSRCAGRDVEPQDGPKRWGDPCFGMCCLCNSSTQTPSLLGADLRDETSPVFVTISFVLVTLNKGSLDFRKSAEEIQLLFMILLLHSVLTGGASLKL